MADELSMEVPNADQALRSLGAYSRWQIRMYCVYSMGFGVPFAWMMMSMVFIADTPNYHCNPHPGTPVNESVPSVCDEEGQCAYEHCTMYRNLSTGNETVSCQYGYWFDPASGYQSTIVTDFHLVCGREWIVELSMTMTSVGLICGSMIFPTISDKFGRKIVFMVCTWLYFAVAVAQVFSVNVWMYLALSYTKGLQLQGMIAAVVVLALELFPTEQRTFAGVCIEFFWAFGYLTCIPFVYLIRNWRYLQFAITAPLVVTVSYYWWGDESIPWLVSTGQMDKADKILKKAAKFSNVALPAHPFTVNQNDYLLHKKKVQVESETNGDSLKPKEGVTTAPQDSPEEESLQYGVADVLRSRKLTLYSLVQFYMWFLDSYGYYSVSWTVTYLPGDRYLNSFLYSVTEIPGYILLWILFHFLGRRISISVFHFVAGIALCATILQKFDLNMDITALVVTCSVIGRTSLVAGFAGLYVQTPELYPTTLRNRGLGSCQMFANLGSLLAPYARAWGRRSAWAGTFVLGIAVLFGGCLCLVLPESGHEALPQTIEDVEHFKRQRKPVRLVRKTTL